MSRSQKKCLMVSAGAHGFLLFTVLVGAAFFVRKAPDTPPPQPLKIIPSALIESALAGGGGDPDVPKTEEQQKGETYVPQPEPKPEPEPKKEPKKVEPKKEEPKKTEPKKVTQSKPTPPKKRVTNPITKDMLVKKSRKPAPKPPAENQLAKELEAAKRALQAGFSKGTAVKVSGSGGAAYASYASLVKARYDDAWDLTEAVAGDDPNTQVSVTIARSGKVISAKIIQRSGSSELDASVQRALNRVTFIAPFPKETEEQQRTFIINFNLKGKQFIG